MGSWPSNSPQCRFTSGVPTFFEVRPPKLAHSLSWPRRPEPWPLQCASHWALGSSPPRTFLWPPQAETTQPHQTAVGPVATETAGLFAVNDAVAHAKDHSVSAASSDAGHGDSAAGSANHLPADLNGQLVGVRGFAIGLISLLSFITCTFGNLAAYGQTNIKRLLPIRPLPMLAT